MVRKWFSGHRPPPLCRRVYAVPCGVLKFADGFALISTGRVAPLDAPTLAAFAADDHAELSERRGHQSEQQAGDEQAGFHTLVARQLVGVVGFIFDPRHAVSSCIAPAKVFRH